MPYIPFISSTPAATQQAVSAMDSTRENLAAVRDAVVIGSFPGWDFTNDSADQEMPTSVMYDKASERIRNRMTYGVGGGSEDLVTIASYAYSSDGGSTYAKIGRMTISYDASSNVTNTTWS